MPPGSQNPDPNSDPKIGIFQTPFQGHKRDMKLWSLLRFEREHKEVHIRFQTQMGKDYTFLLFPDRNVAKTVPSRAAHTLYEGVPRALKDRWKLSNNGTERAWEGTKK